MPSPPRPCLVYSEIGVRLPKPFSVAVSTVCFSSFATSMQTARRLPSSGRRMPRTPVAWRPIGRTSSSWKRIALPSEENSITS